MQLNAIARDNRRTHLLTISLVVFSVCVSGLLVWMNSPTLIRLAFIGATIGIGAWLYSVASPLYLGLILWIWFITPFLRRVIDYKAGVFTPPSESLILLTPFAATVLTIVDIPRFGRRLLQRRYLPFFLCFLGITYGYAVGLVKVGAFEATSMLLKWIAPLLTGFFILNRWKSYRDYRRTLERTLAWGVLALGTYGIIQYFFLPEWDAFWMIHSGMSSVGKPYPYQVRVFSMLDSPGPFAVTIMTGLVMLFIGHGILPILAAVPGYIGFLLAKVRGAWIGWVIAIGVIITRVKGRLRVRLVAMLVAITVLTVPIAMQGPIAEQTGNRMETLENVQEDGSLQARMHMYRTAPPRILTNPIGWGLGSTTFDSGIVTLFWNLGWLGGFLYLLGVVLILRQVLTNPTFFGKIVGGVAAAYAVQFFAGGQLLGQVTGVLFWSLASLAIASQLHARADGQQDPG